MTTATRTPSRPPTCRVPAPAPCHACGGIAPDLDVESPCDPCRGSGWERAWFRLAPARTLQYRRVIFQPLGRGRGLLQLATARKPGGKLAHEGYDVREFPTDWDGRAFFVAKRGTDRTHEAFLGVGGSAGCGCEGTTYEAAAKADRWARECGDETFGSAGCVHLDALKALLAGGWLDLDSTEGRS